MTSRRVAQSKLSRLARDHPSNDEHADVDEALFLLDRFNESRDGLLARRIARNSDQLARDVLAMGFDRLVENVLASSGDANRVRCKR